MHQPPPPRPPRPICSRCARPLRTCLCAWALPTANRLQVLVLQHPQEAAHAKNSVRLLRLSLAQCRVAVGEVFDPQALAGWLGDATHGDSLLLFPDPPTPGCAVAGPPAALPRPARLVLLDGTWRQARALLRANPLLQRLPRWGLPELAPSRYAIRRAHRPGQRSTLEAACAALSLLEDRPALYAPLLDRFSAWVAAEQARQLSAARPAG